MKKATRKVNATDGKHLLDKKNHFASIASDMYFKNSK